MQKEILGTIYTEASADFQRGIYPIARCVKAEKHDLAVIYAVGGGNELDVKQIGNIDNDRETFDNPQCGRVYDSEGLSPTINTCQGGQREPKIIVKSKGHRFKDISGCKFEKLTAIEPVDKRDGAYIWKCKCDCGNYVNVCIRDLRNGHTKSCGCISKNKFPKIHGMSNERIYRIWKDMNQRCNNLNNHAYKRYGGRGIIVCDEWRGENGFQNFYDWSMKNGYSDTLEIDRIDNDGNYEPSNCQWATRKEQMNNVSYNNIISAFGEKRTLSQWSEITGINSSTITSRIKNGWDVEQALSIPAKLGVNQYTICGLRGRNPDNPSDRTAGSPTEQRLEPNSQGICNTLTSVQKDNLVMETVRIKQATKDGYIECNIGGVADLSYPESDTRRGRVQGNGEISPTITATETGVCRIESLYRTRKLTPLECWRLQSFSDLDFLTAKLGSRKAAKETLEKYPHLGKRAFTEIQRVEKMSNTQLYKQTGNSIARVVMAALMSQLNIAGVKPWNETSKEEKDGIIEGKYKELE